MEENMDKLYEMYAKHMMNDCSASPQMQIDYPLYRYRSEFNYVQQEIETGQIHLTSIDMLNDPFEATYVKDFNEALKQEYTVGLFLSSCSFLKNFQWYDTLVQNLNDKKNDWVTLESFSKIVSSELKKFGIVFDSSILCRTFFDKCMLKQNQYGKVASFSEVWDSVPMWAYYANNHQCVCLKYDFSLLEKTTENQNLLASLQKVWYSENVPTSKNSESAPFVKGYEWSHEREWRFFRTAGEDFVSVPCLSEIYLGCNFEMDKLDGIIDAVKKSRRDIKIYALKCNVRKFELEKVKLNL